MKHEPKGNEMLNIRMAQKKPHPCNTRAWHEHLKAVKHATTEQLKREVKQSKGE